MIDKHHIYYLSIGQNLKRKRLSVGLTQEMLARKIPKMDRSKISDMENGKEDFFFSTLLNVCEALDLSLADAVKQHDK